MEYIDIVYQGATLGVGWTCLLSRLQSALLSSALLLLSLPAPASFVLC